MEKQELAVLASVKYSIFRFRFCFAGVYLEDEERVQGIRRFSQACLKKQGEADDRSIGGLGRAFGASRSNVIPEN